MTGDDDGVLAGLAGLHVPGLDVEADLARVHRRSRRRTLLVRGAPVAVLVIVAVGVLAVVDRPTALDRAGVRVLSGNVARASEPPSAAGPATAGLTAFSLDVFRQVAADTPDENTVLSPASVYVTLAMVMLGADGQTRAQLADVLHTDPSTGGLRSLNALANALTAPRPGQQKGPADPDNPSETLPAADGAEVHLANSVWTQKGFDVDDTYLDQLSKTFGADLYTADFAGHTETTRRAVNDWVADRTNGKITDLLAEGQIDDLTRLVLANAVTFSGRWTEPFSADGTLEFTTADGRNVEPDALSGSARGTTGDGWTSATIPIVGNAHLLVVTPDDPAHWRGFVAGLTPELLAAADDTRNETALVMPKFESTTRASLAPVLAELGATDAFDPERADFSGIDGRRDLYLGFVEHQAHVATTRFGVEAQAATVGGFKIVGQAIAPNELRLDHPFVYAIVDDTTGAPLFVGQVTDPTRSS